MIDTLNFKLKHTLFDYNHIKRVFENKTDFKADTKFNIGTALTVKYNNYTFILSEKNLIARGSLTKLYFGNNVQNLNFNQIQDTLMQFETLFEIPFDNAIINRIDIGLNMAVDKPINLYLDMLTTPYGYKPRTYGIETKYFESSKKIIAFYDKIAEIKKKDRPNYVLFKDHQILKYELRLNSTSLSNLNLRNLTIKNLFNPEVYRQLLTEWYQSYILVPKLTTTKPSHFNYHSLTSFKESLITEGINSISGLEALQLVIKWTKIKKDVKIRIKKYLNQFVFIEPLSPILKQELDSKIENAFYNELALLNE